MNFWNFLSLVVVCTISAAGGYLYGRPREIEIRRPDAMAQLTLVPSADESCRVQTTKTHWKIFCGVK